MCRFMKRIVLVRNIGYCFVHTQFNWFLIQGDYMSEEFIVEVTQDLNGESFIELPEEVLNSFNLKEGDTLSWEHLDDMSGYKLKKKQD